MAVNKVKLFVETSLAELRCIDAKFGPFRWNEKIRMNNLVRWNIDLWNMQKLNDSAKGFHKAELVVLSDWFM